MVKMMLRRYGTTCHICGHPGAAQADHLEPLAENPGRALDIENLRPAHGASRGGGSNPCPVCTPAAEARGYGPVYCNTVRQAMSVDRARRVIRARTGLPMPGDAGFSAASQAEGREW
jgi:hypothetical protein